MRNDASRVRQIFENAGGLTVPESHGGAPNTSAARFPNIGVEKKGPRRPGGIGRVLIRDAASGVKDGWSASDVCLTKSYLLYRKRISRPADGASTSACICAHGYLHLRIYDVLGVAER